MCSAFSIIRGKWWDLWDFYLKTDPVLYFFLVLRTLIYSSQLYKNQSHYIHCSLNNISKSQTPYMIWLLFIFFYPSSAKPFFPFPLYADQPFFSSASTVHWLLSLCICSSCCPFLRVAASFLFSKTVVGFLFHQLSLGVYLLMFSVYLVIFWWT